MRRFFLFFSLLLLGIACAPPAHIRHPVAPGDTYFLWVARYSEDKAEEKTASSETYDPRQFTCAVDGFPFGTLLEVRNLDADTAVVVRVTDRSNQNIVFLTPRSFAMLSRQEGERVRGRVKVIGLPGENSLLRRNESGEISHFFTIQLGAFSSFENARAFIGTLEKELSDGVYIYVEQGDRNLYRVRVGRFADRGSAEQVKKQWAQKGKEAVIVEVSE